MMMSAADAVYTNHASDMDLSEVLSAPIDWSRPIVTDAGKPVNQTGIGPLTNVWGWRNATPAEILAHPETWPEWQEWARKELHEQGMAAYEAAMAAEPVPDPNWLTPETAIGCTLPCGAKVWKAETIGERGNILVHFDRAHNGYSRRDRFEYTPAGKHAYNTLPDLIPAAPTLQQKPAITHAAILAAVERLPEHLDGSAVIAEHLCNALGVEVPVKQAPWEVAFDDWRGGDMQGEGSRRAWQAAVEWCVEQIDKELAVFPAAPVKYVRQAIMGQEQQP